MDTSLYLDYGVALPSTASLTFSSYSATLYVSQCVSINSTIQLQLNQATFNKLVLGSERNFTLLNHSSSVLTGCVHLATNASLSTPAQCRSGSTSTFVQGSSLIVQYTITGQCIQWWIVFVGVLGGLAVLVLFVVVFREIWNRCCRSKPDEGVEARTRLLEKYTSPSNARR